MTCQTEQQKKGGSDFVEALVQELTALLEDFVSTGREGMIDLRGLPVRDSDKQQLEELLGVGEVRATLAVAGETQIWETALSGIWWVRHKGAGDQIISEQIVVTQCPEILKTHKADAQTALKRLQKSFYHSGNKEQGEFIS